MQTIVLLLALSSSYFVEWIPNLTVSSPQTATTTDQSPGEFPWQLSQ
jgi:hypothetical protein